MLRVFLLIFVAGAAAQATDVVAQIDECQPEAAEKSEDMYLIQKKVEVGVTNERLITDAIVKKNDSSNSSAGGDNSSAGGGDNSSAAGGDAEGANASGNATAAGSNCSGWIWPYFGCSWDSDKSVFSNVYHSWDIYVVSTVITWLIWVLLALLVWNCCFPEEPELFRDPDDPIETFEHDHFGCFKRFNICLCATCCPAVQWADTMHLAGIIKATTALPIFFFCALLNGLFGGFYAWGIFTAILICMYRQRLREKLGVKSWTSTTCFFDCLYVCCCPCCAIAQEAQVVRYAYQMGGATRSPTPTMSRTVYSVPGSINSGAAPFAAGRVASDRVIYTGPINEMPRPVPLVTEATGPVITGPAPVSSGNVIYTRSLSPETRGRTIYR